MTSEMKFYSISEIPSKVFDTNKIFECTGQKNLMLVYDFERSISLMGFEDQETKNIPHKISTQIPGLAFSANDISIHKSDFVVFSVYRNVEEFGTRFFHEVFDTLPSVGFLGILFAYTPTEEVNLLKINLERLLSSKNVRETESFLKDHFSKRINSATQRELYYDSEEKLMLNSVIESLNNSILSNGLAYKIFLITPSNANSLHEYINTHFLVLAKYNFNRTGIKSVTEHLSKKPSLSFGTNYAKEFMNFYGFYSINHTLDTHLPSKEQGITIGKFVKEGVSETELDIKLDPSAINLGFIITGLPGSGKTREAMSIMDSVLTRDHYGKKPSVFVITPTAEWKNFALAHGMFFIKPYDDNTPINFFRCPETIEIEKFYGNLAMILSSAANAGPYQNPMEKCILNAFRKIYNQSRKPDPIEVYEEIEESIIKYHGKRIANGIKYTKHGENIKSALENLRGILTMPQYCIEEGIKLEDFLDRGAVFDISNASVNAKTQLYALILNQIYALTSNFDTNGDDELRLVICLDEAQTVFGATDSPAVRDIKQRIQDFRKQGIGLILLTHNVSDIEVGIRRLCQLKLYLKQAPDIAVIASKDLIFAHVDPEDVILKLKTLKSRIGALSSIAKNRGEKRQLDTIFMKTNTYEPITNTDLQNPMIDYVKRLDLNAAKLIKCKLSLKLEELRDIKSNDIQDYYIRFNFLGETIATIPFNEIDSYELLLLEGKEYLVNLLNKRNRVLKELHVKASDKIYIDIKNN